MLSNQNSLCIYKSELYLNYSLKLAFKTFKNVFIVQLRENNVH